MADLTLWAVSCNDDLTEGRGREYVKHFCRSRATALRLARRNYVQGTDCPVYQITALEFEGRYVLPISLINIVEPTKEDIVVQGDLDKACAALEKAKALGLTEDEIVAIVKAKGAANA